MKQIIAGVSHMIINLISVAILGMSPGGKYKLSVYISKALLLFYFVKSFICMADF